MQTQTLNDTRMDQGRIGVFTDLDLFEYKKALDLQVSTQQEKLKDPARPDRVFFVQHPQVYTLGKRGGRENLMVSEKFLQEKKISIVQTDRGGNITFHGPGQAVLYPVVDLERARIGVADFVYGLEEIMKRTARDFDIPADRDPKNHGLWVKNRKIGSVGIAIKKGVSIHGLALNINPDLTPFSWINPCGLENVSMTSIELELLQRMKGQNLNGQLSMDNIKSKFSRYFCEIFDYTFIEDDHV